MLGSFLLHIVISAIAVINETIDKGDHQSTLHALQANAAKLSSIAADNSQLYQKLLLSQKIAKAQVRMVEGHYGSIDLNQNCTKTEAVFTHNQSEKCKHLTQHNVCLPLMFLLMFSAEEELFSTFTTKLLVILSGAQRT